MISQPTTTTSTTTLFMTAMHGHPINKQRRDVVSKNEKIVRHDKVEIIYPTLGPYDIIFGRCSNAFNNIGNRRFRVTISLNVQRYIDAPTREDKGQVITSVVALLKNEIGARFFGVKGGKLGGKLELELDGTKIRKKVGHALRDTAANRTLGSFATIRSSFSSVRSSSSSSFDHSAREERPLPQKEQHKKLMEDTNDLLVSFSTYWMSLEEGYSVPTLGPHGKW
jgi:hypothetical protein